MNLQYIGNHPEEEGRLLRLLLGGDAAADRFRGRRPVFVDAVVEGGTGAGDRGAETACCIDASLDPKKLPNPPRVLFISGMADGIGVESFSELTEGDDAMSASFPFDGDCTSRSRSLLATSLLTPSNALKRLDEPAARAVPIASRVGPSWSCRCKSWNPSANSYSIRSRHQVSSADKHIPANLMPISDTAFVFPSQGCL